MTKYLLLFILLGYTFVSGQERINLPFEFGTSRNEIKAALGSSITEENESTLITNGIFSDRKCKTAYVFSDTTLFLIAYQLDGRYNTLNEAETEYNAIQKLLTAQFGEVFEVIEEWQDPELEGTMSKEEAVKQGVLIIQSIWQQNDLIIVNAIASEETGVISVGVVFMSTSFMQMHFLPEEE